MSFADPGDPDLYVGIWGTFLGWHLGTLFEVGVEGPLGQTGVGGPWGIFFGTHHPERRFST